MVKNTDLLTNLRHAPSLGVLYNLQLVVFKGFMYNKAMLCYRYVAITTRIGANLNTTKYRKRGK